MNSMLPLIIDWIIIIHSTQNHIVLTTAGSLSEYYSSLSSVSFNIFSSTAPEFKTVPDELLTTVAVELLILCWTWCCWWCCGDDCCCWSCCNCCCCGCCVNILANIGRSNNTFNQLKFNKPISNLQIFYNDFTFSLLLDWYHF